MELLKCTNSNSGNVAAYGFDPVNGTLEVLFHNKKGDQAYRYAGVPQDKWVGLLRAHSAGSYLRSEIIPFYKCEKV